MKTKFGETSLREKQIGKKNKKYEHIYNLFIDKSVALFWTFNVRQCGTTYTDSAKLLIFIFK